MRSYTRYIIFETKKKHEFVNITKEVQQAVWDSNIAEGIILINSMHITSSVFVNDEEEGLKKDFIDWLEKLAPQNFKYNHNESGEDNGYSHLWRTVMGREVVCAITKGRLDLGPWEQIFYGEFDGMRKKRVLIKILGE